MCLIQPTIFSPACAVVDGQRPSKRQLPVNPGWQVPDCGSAGESVCSTQGARLLPAGTKLVPADQATFNAVPRESLPADRITATRFRGLLYPRISAKAIDFRTKEAFARPILARFLRGRNRFCSLKAQLGSTAAGRAFQRRKYRHRDFGPNRTERLRSHPLQKQNCCENRSPLCSCCAAG
jgi:hypothetical protein